MFIVAPLQATVLWLSFEDEINTKASLRFLCDIVTPLQATVLGLSFEDEINTKASLPVSLYELQ